MSLESRVHLSLVAHETENDDLASSIRVTAINNSFPFADGTGANQAQVCWGITATCGTSTVQYDMRSLPSDRGNVTVTATKVCYVKNLSTDKHIKVGGYVGVGAYGAFPQVAPLEVHEGGVYCLVAPDAAAYATSGVAVFANIASTAGTAAFQFIIIGEGTAP